MMKHVVLIVLAALFLAGCQPEAAMLNETPLPQTTAHHPIMSAAPVPAPAQTPMAALPTAPSGIEGTPEPSAEAELPDVVTIAVHDKKPFDEIAGILIGGSRENTRAWLELLPESETPMLGARLHLETGNDTAAAFNIFYRTQSRPRAITLVSFADLNGDGTDEVLAQVDHGSTSGDRFGYVLAYEDGALRPLWALYSDWITDLDGDTGAYLQEQLGIGSVIKTYSCLALNMKEADGSCIIEVIFYVSEQERRAEYQYTGDGWRVRVPGEDWQDAAYPIVRLPISSSSSSGSGRT